MIGPKFPEPINALTDALQQLAQNEARLRPDERLVRAHFWRFAAGAFMKEGERNSWTYALDITRHISGHDYPRLQPQSPADRVAMVMKGWQEGIADVERRDTEPAQDGETP